MEKKLFDDSETFQRERPIKMTDSQSEKMYRDIAQEIIDNGHSSSSLDVIIEDLKEISFYDSGYEIAKSLESWQRNGDYDFTTDFIEFLDELSWRKKEILEKNVEDWVKAVKPQPKYSIGTQLVCTGKLRSKIYEGDTAFVNGIDDKHARYLIDRERDAQRNYVIDFEVVESLTKVPD